jgi:hypothetical protein
MRIFGPFSAELTRRMFPKEGRCVSMPHIQAFKVSNRRAGGSKGKEYWRHFVVIPKTLVVALGWKKGDEVEFKLENGKVALRKREVIK